MFAGNQHTIAARRQITAQWRVFIEHMALDAGAACHVHEVGLKTNQAARRNTIIEADPPASVRDHVEQVGTALAQCFHHSALIGVFNVHSQHFVGLALLAVDFFHHHPRLADGQLVTFAAHDFQQDRQVQFTTA